MNQEYIMYAGELDSGNLWDFYKYVEVLKLCEPKVIYKVQLTISNEGTYWGWYDNEKQDITLVYYAEGLLDMCFPYGAKAEIDRGNGEIVRLKVVKLEKVL